MKDKGNMHVHLSQDESDRMQRYLKEISKIYGIRLAELGEFLGKRLKDHVKGEHQWFMAFMIIDEIFDEMVDKIMTTLKTLRIIGPLSGNNVLEDASRKKLFKSIIRETQALIKEELPLPKIDTAYLLKEKDSSGEAPQDKI